MRLPRAHHSSKARVPQDDLAPIVGRDERASVSQENTTVDISCTPWTGFCMFFMLGNLFPSAGIPEHHLPAYRAYYQESPIGRKNHRPRRILDRQWRSSFFLHGHIPNAYRRTLSVILTRGKSA